MPVLVEFHAYQLVRLADFVHPQFGVRIVNGPSDNISRVLVWDEVWEMQFLSDSKGSVKVVKLWMDRIQHQLTGGLFVGILSGAGVRPYDSPRRSGSTLHRFFPSQRGSGAQQPNLWGERRFSQDKCIQCNVCSAICPHAVIRPFLLSHAELMQEPTGFGRRICSLICGGDLPLGN